MDAHHHHEPVRAEPDLVPASAVIVGIALVVGSFLIGIYWSYKIQRREEGNIIANGGFSEEKPQEATHAFKYEVGLINQQQFETEGRAYTLQGQQKKSLNEYGWADRKANLAYVPLEEGIKKVTAQYGGNK